MSPAMTATAVWTERFPRVSGDEPAAVEKNGQTLEFSPRERG